jgi:hypothetical protein
LDTRYLSIEVGELSGIWNNASMRILVVIAHYFQRSGEPHPKYGSLRGDPRPRVSALTASVTTLHRLFGPRQYMFDYVAWRADGANRWQDSLVDIVICTSRSDHVLDQLGLPTSAYTHQPTSAEPMLLGFECQTLLRDRLGHYDFYCYMEDDLVIHDPMFFTKLSWFTTAVADATALLQPNRYECDSYGGGRKAYVDGHLNSEVTKGLQPKSRRASIVGKLMGQRMTFYRASNPHSGCYFLTEAQMESWSRQSHFLDRDVSFVGPLESAATLGIMRTFKIYKPAPENACFLEVEHAAGEDLLRIENQSPHSDPPLPLQSVVTLPRPDQRRKWGERRNRSARRRKR